MAEIWIAGAPSLVGGADTELYHQIILWRKHNISVNIVPNADGCISTDMTSKMINIGCQIHKYEPNIFQDKHVVAYCNGESLERAPSFKSKSFIWFNCMTWTFDKEIELIKNKHITHLGFVSNYQMNYLIQEYSKKLPEMCINNTVVFGEKGFPQKVEYSPYFDISQYQVLQKDSSYFGVGRISRNDPSKFSDDCWKIFDKVCSPIQKKTFILGYSDDVEKRIGKPPVNLDWAWWSAGGISAQEFFSKIDVMIHKTGGSRESYCRVLVESMAHGVVPLVERNYAFPEILQYSPELDFLMCNSSDEMSYKASQLAFDVSKLVYYKNLCRDYVEKFISNNQSLLGFFDSI